MWRVGGLAIGAVVACVVVSSCTRSNVDQFLSRTAPTASVVALTNVRVIDGTGAPGKDDQTLVIRDRRIAALGRTADVLVPADAQRLDLRGRTVIPGLVGVHDHLFYHVGGAENVATAPESFSMLYLATGVTTIRTAGSVDLDGDLRIKRLIDEGKRPGPAIYITSPYLHAQTPTPDPDRVARDVAAWADRGATSFKAYESLRRVELKAAIDAAHAESEGNRTPLRRRLSGGRGAGDRQPRARLARRQRIHAGAPAGRLSDFSQRLGTALSLDVTSHQSNG